MKRKAVWLTGIIACLLILTGLSAAQESGNTLYATKIIDIGVYDSNGHAIGEVDDLVVRRNGKIKIVTMDVGGFLNIGAKLVAYPFGKLTFERDKVVVDATEQQLEKRKEFNYYEQGLSAGYYYGPYPPYANPVYGPYYGRYYGPAWGANVPYQGMKRKRYDAELWAYSPGRFLASVVIGRRIINPDGQPLGEIKDLTIDEKGKVEKIVIEADLLGDGIYVALPYEEPGFTYYGIVYDITSDELAKMPKVDYKE
jgi:sporulation protein YlmC with PRC-barrel domain